MKIISLQQGSPAWHAHRRWPTKNASDAPAALGESPHCSRTDLLHRMATGLVPEVDDRTQERFNDGHKVEALLRPLGEERLCEPLHQFVGVADFDENLSASFDGCTFVGDTVLECKLLNARLRAAFADMETIDPDKQERQAGKRLPIDYRIQMEQQIRVAEAERALFMTGELRADGTLGDVFSCWYYPDDALWVRIRSGWEQFAADLAAYVPPAAEAPKPTGRAPETLPALHIEVTGQVTASNLAEFKANALAVFAGINRNLTTDADFADAEKTVKWCGDVEDRLKAAKQHALSQTASIDELFRAIDDISAEARTVRLELDKLVKARKEAIRGEIVAEGGAALREHIAKLNERFARPLMPIIPADFAAAVKGKKTVASLRDGVNTELARAKIAANEVADRIDANLRHLAPHAAERGSLFPDTDRLVLKAPEDFAATVAARIADDKQRQEAERERIRKEEADRLQREADEKARREAAAATTAQPPAAAPIASPALSSQAAVGNVRPLARPTHAPATPPTLTLGAIGTRLGFPLTAAFLKSLGFEPAAKEGAALKFHEAEFALICMALISHITSVAEQRAAA